MNTGSEKVLYLKYRPQTFEEIVGNEDIVEVLRNQLAGKCLGRSILLHGPTGCGKTTLARIIAKELGAKGADLHEVDSADFRGIDTIRAIRTQSNYRPLESPCRVWILDEVHRLTQDAQSALLKILEDTPNHIYFILCTTDPQKLLSTIRGRCSQFQVNTLTDKQMKRLLYRLVKMEEETLSKEVYDQIIQDSAGHPRNALQILAQVLAVPEEKRLAVAKKSAETQSKTIELCRALMTRTSWAKIANILKGLRDQDPEQIRRAVLGYCQTVLLNSSTGGGQAPLAAMIMEEFMEPFFNSGYSGLVFACFSVMCGED